MGSKITLTWDVLAEQQRDADPRLASNLSSFAKLQGRRFFPRPATLFFARCSCTHTFCLVNGCNLRNITRDGLREAKSRKRTGPPIRRRTSLLPEDTNAKQNMGPCLGLAKNLIFFVYIDF